MCVARVHKHAPHCQQLVTTERQKKRLAHGTLEQKEFVIDGKSEQEGCMKIKVNGKEITIHTALALHPVKRKDGDYSVSIRFTCAEDLSGYEKEKVAEAIERLIREE